ncbi:MAG: holo-ACP synthase CitX, partial [Tenericutes bacterium GWA2_35_7]
MHDTILAAREQRAKTIELWLHQGHELVLSIRANMPTELRESHEAYLVVRFFESLIKKRYTISDTIRFDSSDGPYTLFSLSLLNAKQFKRDLIQLEESIPLGRLIDLDLWQTPDQLWTRSSLGIPPRKCYLCDQPAHQCVRSRKHDVKDIITFIKRIVKQHLDDEIKEIAEHAVIKELNLDHKFGLVTPT